MKKLRIKQYLRRLFLSISNLFSYFKVIWNDRQWDMAYIEYILLVKYKLMYKHMCSDNCMKSVDQEEYKQALRICINILERRRNDFYIDIWDYNYGRFSEIEWSDHEEEGILVKYEKKDKIHGNEDYTGGPTAYQRIIEERDWKTYCKLVEKYHNHWWD